MNGPSWLAAIAAATLLAAPAAAQQNQVNPQSSGSRTPALAGADLVGTDGRRIGSVALVETPSGVLVQLEINQGSGLQQGLHGFHIHETGQCDGPEFTSAGGHFNPGGKSHGFLSPQGPHAGDLPNVWVDRDGSARADILTDRVSLREGQANLLKQGGAAIVVHATPDDYVTDPAGKAGNRVACGLVRPSTR